MSSIKIRLKKSPTQSVGKTLGSVPRHQANIEAERGESVVADFDGDGFSEHMNIEGNRHSKGGTPLHVPDGAFVFSDTAKMKLGGAVLEGFGKSATTKKKYTPAELARQYDLNKYKAILDDPNSDPFARKTAEVMSANLNEKLGKLALVQEATKGFPTGIPEIAMPYLPEGLLPEQGGAQDPMMRFGGSVPLARNGIEFLDDPIIDLNRQKKLDDLKKMGYDVNLSNRQKSGDNDVEPIQHNKDGLYGGIQKDEVSELKKRHPWYFEGKTNWDAGNEADVRDFQTNYEIYAKRRELDPYFNGTDQKNPWARKDGKLGEYTYNAPSLDINLKAQYAPLKNTGTFASPEIQNTTIPSSYKPGTHDPAAGDAAVSTPGSSAPFDYMTPDKWSMAEAAKNRMGLKKYLPSYASPNVYVPNATFYDPTRELAANSEQAATQGMQNAMFSGAQRQRAVGSSIQGQAGANAANVIGKYDNLNVNVANTVEAQQAAAMSQQSAFDTDVRNKTYEGNVIANQQFDNSKRQANSEVLKSKINAWNNRSMLDMTNQTNQRYQIDPETGRMFLRKGFNGKDVHSGSSEGEGDIFAEAQKIKKDLIDRLGYSDEDAAKEAFATIKARRTTTQKTNDPSSESSRLQETLLGLYGRKP